jgi:hypothetical protein
MLSSIITELGRVYLESKLRRIMRGVWINSFINFGLYLIGAILILTKIKVLSYLSVIIGLYLSIQFIWNTIPRLKYIIPISIEILRSRDVSKGIANFIRFKYMNVIRLEVKMDLNIEDIISEYIKYFKSSILQFIIMFSSYSIVTIIIRSLI